MWSPCRFSVLLGAVAALLDESDMLVLPSFAEGVLVVLMEAMASRIPVIATRVAGVPELVADGVVGYTIPPGDVATLAERIGRLMKSPELAAMMGQAGRQLVKSDFNIEKEGAWLAVGDLFGMAGASGRLRPTDQGNEALLHESPRLRAARASAAFFLKEKICPPGQSAASTKKR